MWDTESGRGTDEAGQAGPGRDMVVPLSEAAVLLGVSVAAVKKRIQRGTLPGHKVGGKWFVALTGTDGTPVSRDSRPAMSRDMSGQVAGTQERDTAGQVPVTTQSQVDAIRDGLVAPLVELTERQQETIRDLERENGRVTAERDALQARLRALEAQHAESPTQTSSAPQTATRDATDAPWWQFWKRS